MLSPSPDRIEPSFQCRQNLLFFAITVLLGRILGNRSDGLHFNFRHFTGTVSRSRCASLIGKNPFFQRYQLLSDIFIMRVALKQVPINLGGPLQESLADIDFGDGPRGDRVVFGLSRPRRCWGGDILLSLVRLG
jgi:hypothetical protein